MHTVRSPENGRAYPLRVLNQAEDDDDWGGVGALACPHCLVLLEVDGFPEHPYLVCPRCHLVRMTA